MGLRNKVTRSLGWSAVENWGTQAISFVVLLVLARLLSPDEFGLVATASVFVGFLNMWVSLGLPQAIVQRDVISEDHLDTAFWANIGVAIALGIVSLVLAGFVANWYVAPELKSIIAWLSLGLILNGLSQTQIAILQREMAFKNLAKRSTIARLVAGGVGVTAAFAGMGAYSLVLQTLVNASIAAIVLWRVSGWRPKFRFSWQRLKELYSFGINVTGSQIIFFASNRLDDLIVGYFLGTTALGYYKIGFTLLERINGLLGGVTNTVAFSAFSRIQNESLRLKQAFLQGVKLFSTISIPVFAALALLAPELTTGLFGDKWLPSVPIMQFLALSLLIRSVLSFNGTAVNAMGKPEWLVRVRGVEAILRLIFFTLGAQFSVVAVASMHLVTSLLLAPVYLKLVQAVLGFIWKDYYILVKDTFISVMFMIIMGVILKVWLSGYVISDVVRLGVIVPLIGASFVISLSILDSSRWKEFGQVVRW